MANKIKESASRASAWLLRTCDRIYTSQVKESVPPGWKSYIFMFRVTGIWHTTDDSCCYKLLTIALVVLIGIPLPLSQSVNVFFEKSIPEAMSHLLVSLSNWGTTFKAVTLYWHRDSTRDIFRIHTRLSYGAGCTAEHRDRLARINFLIHAILTTLYYAVYIGFMAQIILAKPEDRIYASTLHFPYEFCQRHSVYLTVLVLQVTSNSIGVITVATEDTFYVALMNTANDHLVQLKGRLQGLGSSGGNREFYRDWIECCKRYEDCWRCDIHHSYDHILIPKLRFLYLALQLRGENEQHFIAGILISIWTQCGVDLHFVVCSVGGKQKHILKLRT